jgi:DNA replication licensing factor MCM4
MPPSPNAAAEAEEEEAAAAAAAEGTRSPGGAVMPPATAASQGFATSPMTASPARSHPPNTPGAMSHVSATPGMAMRSPYGTEATTSEAGDLVDRMPFSPSIDGVSPSGRRSEPRPRGGGGRWSRDPNLFTPPQGMMGGAMGEGDQFGESDVDPTQSQGSAQYAADDPTATFGAQNSTMVWGTTISLHEAMTNAKHFLRDYVAPSDGGTAPGEPLYPQLLRQSKEDNSYNLNIDAHHLRSFDDEHGYHLYRDLVRYPQEMVPIFDLCVYEEFHRLYGEEADEQKRFQVRVFNLDQVKAMRDLNPKDIDTLVCMSSGAWTWACACRRGGGYASDQPAHLRWPHLTLALGARVSCVGARAGAVVMGSQVSVQGMVVRASAIQPDLKQAFFECSACGMSVTVSIDRGRINEPQACTSCDAKYSYVLKHNRCLFTDKQVVKMQETPESMPEGETPATITVCAYDDLVDHGKPGDRAVITGVYRAVPMRINPRKRNVMTVFRTYIDVIHYQKNTRSRFAAEDARQSRDSEFHTSVEERATLEDQIAQEEVRVVAAVGIISVGRAPPQRCRVTECLRRVFV